MVITREAQVHRFVNEKTGEEVMAFVLEEPTIVHLVDGSHPFFPGDYEVIHGDGKVTVEDKLSFELEFKEAPMPKAEDITV